jgi:glycerol-3-phosphate acyltransferase PlsX
VDVVVCDGFTGNVTLKTMEGTAFFIMEVLKDAFRRSPLSRLGYLLSRKAIVEAYARLDYSEYGGAPLLGLNGVAIVAHGGSGPKAIKNAIRVADETVSHDVNRHIAEDLAVFADIPGEKLPRKIWQQIQSKVENFLEKKDPEPRGSESKSGRN